MHKRNSSLSTVFSISLILSGSFLASSVNVFSRITSLIVKFRILEVLNFLKLQFVFTIPKFKFSFDGSHFFAFCFFYLHHCRLLKSYMFLLLIQQILSWLFHLIHLFKSWSVKAFFSTFYNVFVSLISFYINNEAVCIHIAKFYIFTIFWFYIIMPIFIDFSFI